MTTLPMVVDIRLVRLANGWWRVRINGNVYEMGALTFPAFVHALVRDIVHPRHHGRSRWDVPEGGA